MKGGRKCVCINHLLGSSQHGGQRSLTFIKLLNRPLYRPLQNLLCEVELVTRRPPDPDPRHRLQRIHHRARRPKSTSKISPRLAQVRRDHLGEVEEERLPPLGRLLRVAEGQLLVRAPRQLDEVEAVRLELRAQGCAVRGREPAVLELDAVDFDPHDEAWVVDARADGGGDLEDYAGAVRERAAVGVGALVCAGCEELREEVAAGVVVSICLASRLFLMSTYCAPCSWIPSNPAL